MCKRRRFDPNAEIAKLLIRAQNGSNGGKGINPYTTDSKCIEDNAKGYELKDSCIKEAIKLCKEHTCDFSFRVRRNWDGKAAFVIGFETIFEGKKHQVSFHGNDMFYKQFCCKKCPSFNRRTRACEEVVCIYRHYVPGGVYA